MVFTITQLAPDLIGGTGHLAAYYKEVFPEESINATFLFKPTSGEAVGVDAMKKAAKAFLIRVANEL